MDKEKAILEAIRLFNTIDEIKKTFDKEIRIIKKQHANILAYIKDLKKIVKHLQEDMSWVRDVLDDEEEVKTTEPIYTKEPTFISAEDNE